VATENAKFGPMARIVRDGCECFWPSFSHALGLQLAGDGDLHALGQGLGDVLGEVLPGDGADPEGVSVDPVALRRPGGGS
jgi:hypothetical protein